MRDGAYERDSASGGPCVHHWQNNAGGFEMPILICTKCGAIPDATRYAAHVEMEKEAHGGNEVATDQDRP